MTLSNELRLLTRKPSLTTEEWIQLLEARRERLASFLGSFALKQLGEYGRYEFPNSRSLLSAPGQVTSPDDLSLSTRGIFKSEGFGYEDIRKETASELALRRHWIWGLTREAQWVFVTVDCFYTSVFDVQSYNVHIEKLSLPAMMEKAKVTPTKINQVLSKEVAYYVKRRRELLVKAEELEGTFSVEDQALALIPSGS